MVGFFGIVAFFAGAFLAFVGMPTGAIGAWALALICTISQAGNEIRISILKQTQEITDLLAGQTRILSATAKKQGITAEERGDHWTADLK